MTRYLNHKIYSALTTAILALAGTVAFSALVFMPISPYQAVKPVIENHQTSFTHRLPANTFKPNLK